MRRRPDLFELGIVSVFAAMVGYVIGTGMSRPPDWASGMTEGRAGEVAPHLQDLARRYGPGHISRGPEEWIARDFFHDRRQGFFVDVGASDYKHENNTYLLEPSLGWRGIAIDAQREFAAGYEKHRPGHEVLRLFRRR